MKAAKFIEGCKFVTVNLLFRDFAKKQLCIAFFCVIHVARSYVLPAFAV